MNARLYILPMFAAAACATTNAPPQLARRSLPTHESILNITLAHGSPRELATRTQLGRLLSAYNVKPWLFTRDVVIDEEAIPHSHPALTLHARHLRDDDQLLSTLIHEEPHWFVDSRPDRLERVVADFRTRFPGIPVGFPDGATSERSSYEHLPVIYLEYEGLRSLVGDQRADATFRFWEGDHYRALYRLVREHRAMVAGVLAQDDLVPPFLHVNIKPNDTRLFESEPQTGDEFARSERDAINGDVLDRLVREADASRSDSLLVLKDGKLVCERYFEHERGAMDTMSVTKSFVSLAIGFLLADGKITSLDVPLSRYFSEFKAGIKAKVTLRHVLTHTSGLEHRPAAGVLTKQEDRLAYVKALPAIEEPGNKFSYNNEAVQLLSGVIATAAKKPVDAYLAEKLFTSLGIDGWTWAKDQEGQRRHVLWPLALGARSGKVGQVLLSGGRYRDRQVVPSSWINESTRPVRGDISWSGYLWWFQNDGPWFVQSADSLAGYVPASFGAASKLASLRTVGRTYLRASVQSRSSPIHDTLTTRCASSREVGCGGDDLRLEEPSRDEGLDDAPHLTLAEARLKGEAVLRRPPLGVIPDVHFDRIEDRAFRGTQVPAYGVVQAMPLGSPVPRRRREAEDPRLAHWRTPLPPVRPETGRAPRTPAPARAGAGR
jgi:hypothetical protein